MRIFLQIIGIVTALQSEVHAGNAPIKKPVNYSEENKVESKQARSLRGSNFSSSVRNLVINGKEIQKNEYPYLAFLKIVKLDEKTPLQCGGTLIQPNWILTAAHCTDGAVNVTASLGLHHISLFKDINITTEETGVEHHVIQSEDIYIYPVYDSRLLDGDFSLLYLENASNKTTPIVNTDIFVPAEKDTVSVVGWGRYDIEMDISSPVPLEASLQVVDSMTCKVAYADMIQDNTMVITNDMICATGWAKGSVCWGDSGGPVVKKDSSGIPSTDILVGVVSFSESCNEPNRPDVYSRISAAMSWLTTMISSSSPSPGPTTAKITNPITSSPTPAVFTSPEPTNVPVTSPPSIQPVTQPVAAGCSRIEENIDYEANDIGSAQSESAEGCCSICSNYFGCNAFAWNNFNGGTCWLKSAKGSAIVKSGVRSAVLSSSICTPIEENIDYVGNLIGQDSSATAEGCCSICNNFTGCKAYTWSNTNGGTCWLKSGKGDIVTSSGMRSAVLGSSYCATMTNDVDYWGNDFATASSTSADGCCLNCKDTNGCKAFAWNSFTNTCWLKTTKNSGSAYNGTVAGTIYF